MITMSAPGTVTVEHPEIADTDLGNGGSVVVVYDNDYNTFEEVMEILQLATGCSVEEAYMETWEVHHLGRSVVHHGERDECQKVASVISRIGIRVTVDDA
jgi:ATP-dependent Clp protease adaptor protein ClpS